MPQLEKLRVLDILGVFYRESDGYSVADEFDGTVSVDDRLRSFEQGTLRVLAHHRPQEPLLQDRWSGGCCLYEPQGWCPFGHHEDPHRLYTFDEEGVLTPSSSGWVVRTSNGDKPIVMDYLVGHRSQITLINKPDLDNLEKKVRSFDPGNLENASVDELIKKASGLRDFLSQLQSEAKDLDV